MAAIQKGLGAATTALVTEVPKLDLEAYIQNYRGRTRTARLLLVANASTVLSLDALKLAVRDAINGCDVELYKEVVRTIHAIDPNDPAGAYNAEWVATTEKANQIELNRLETELRGYKNNLVKESIRMGNEDLGKHHESMGDLNQAYDIYSKMRADASSPKHIIETGQHLARVSVLRRDWSMVITNCNKIGGLNMEKSGDKAVCNVNYGIGHLGQGKYEDAAGFFARVDPTVPASAYDELASPNDIATYGGLLSLATMDRPGLTRFLDHSTFRTFLELEPQFRRAISQFVNGRYSACLAILDSHRPDYLLDIYLQPHVPELYRMIRAKCIFHFLQPFSCVTIDSMNAAFAVPGESIEPELVDMIRHGGLQARIDPIERVITTAKVNPRAQMQTQALAAARQYEKDATDRIRRIAIISADLEVKGKRKTKDSGVAPWGTGPDTMSDYQASVFLASQH